MDPQPLQNISFQHLHSPSDPLPYRPGDVHYHGGGCRTSSRPHAHPGAPPLEEDREGETRRKLCPWCFETGETWDAGHLAMQIADNSQEERRPSSGGGPTTPERRIEARNPSHTQPVELGMLSTQRDVEVNFRRIEWIPSRPFGSRIAREDDLYHRVERKWRCIYQEV